MSDTEREFMPLKEFMEILPISKRTERRRRRSGQPWIPHLRLGNRVYYRRAAVEDFLRALEAACTSDAAVGDQDPVSDDTPDGEGIDNGGATK